MPFATPSPSSKRSAKAPARRLASMRGTMTLPELVAAVKKLRPPFLEELESADLHTILGLCRQRHFMANSIITNQGHPASHIYLVLSGGARSFFVTQGGQRLHVHWYPPGEIFGGMALVPRESEYIVTTEAVKDSHTLSWDRATIRSLVHRYPKLLDNAMIIASEYMNMAIATQVALTCHSARERVAETLVNLASGVGHRVSGGIELTVRNEELAAAANVTPYTVSRLMSEWQRSGMISKSRGKVVMPCPERLLMHEI
jgi:CRP/FNR family transcriptional regulator, nitrogen oxide reductase regulator